MSIRALRLTLALMVSLSSLLLIWHAKGMNRSVALNQASTIEVSTFSDINNGGKSSAVFSWSNSSATLDCNIDTSYQWPYCESSLKIRELDNALDLTQFDFVRLQIKSEGEGPQNIKIYLRNFNPKYATSDKDNSFKINQLQYDPNKEAPTLDIPLNTFVVPAWWMNEMQLSPIYAAQEIDRVMYVEIATGDYRQPGHHKITIEKIEFHGKWIQLEVLLEFLLGTWIVFALTTLLTISVKNRKVLISERRTKEALQSINKALSLEKIELEEQAKRDELTGALNRYGLSQKLLNAVQQSNSHHSNLSLILMDIDHFKSINDQFGHDTGDMILKQFSQLIEGSVRATDSFGRWGGEEFVLLCPNSRLEQTRIIAEHLRQKINQHSWSEGINISCSFGVAHMKDNENIASVIKRTDLALYQAKELGRDRVEISQ